MKSTPTNSSKKNNSPRKRTEETSSVQTKKTLRISSPRQKGDVSVSEWFLHFTANIIKEDTLFTR
jgi:hypothetical protein